MKLPIPRNSRYCTPEQWRNNRNKRLKSALKDIFIAVAFVGALVLIVSIFASCASDEAWQSGLTGIPHIETR